MPLIDLNKVPGYAEAVDRQDLVRDAAFLGVPEILCGLEVSAMTFRHLLWLQMIRSPFVGLSSLTPETLHLDVAAFFKTVAPLPKPSFLGVANKADLKSFMLKVGKLKAPDAVKGIRDFISENFMDAPGGGDNSGPSYYSVGASVINRLCSKYGGLNPNPMIFPSAIDMPLKSAWQLLKCLKRDENPKAILFNGLSDKVRARWIDSQNQPAEDN